MKSKKLRYVMSGVVLFTLTWLFAIYVYSSNTSEHSLNALIINGKHFHVSDEIAKKLKNQLSGFQPLPMESGTLNSSGLRGTMLKQIPKSTTLLPDNDVLRILQRGHAKAISDALKINSKNNTKEFLIKNIKEKLDDHKKQHLLEFEMEGHDSRQLGDEDSKPQVAGEKETVFYTVTHKGAAVMVHHKLHEIPPVMSDHVPPESYIFTTNKLPQNPKFMATVANGYLGTAIGSDKVFMNGVYSGPGSESHRAVIPSVLDIDISLEDTITTHTYSLNVAEGVYSEIISTQSYKITKHIYAHRIHQHLLVLELDLTRTNMVPVTLNLKQKRWRSSGDITFLGSPSGIQKVEYWHGSINAPETADSPIFEVHLLYDEVPLTLSASKASLRNKWVFLMAVGANEAETYTAYEEGAELILKNDALYYDHLRGWSALWSRGCIEVWGDVRIARAVFASQYYLLSSLPLNSSTSAPFFGLSPTGLPYGDQEEDYYGHMFWDQETWLFPPILMLHHDLAKMILRTRQRTVYNAEANAKKHKRDGLQYPWESAVTGLPVSLSPECEEQELHISGDISLAIVQYLYATKDIAFLKSGYLDIVIGIARLWVSLLQFDHKSEKNGIFCVMPPDEYAKCVNNSVYTNTIAKMSMNAVQYVTGLMGAADNRFKPFADAMYIPLDKTHWYHPEYDGYKIGTMIKQADVVLLGYPLVRHMEPNVRKNDLEQYEKVVNASDSPAMTWSMYSIGWLELNNREKADQMFEKNWHYIQEDFQVWSELPNGKGGAHFITGMGGFLQNILAGYAGFRLHSNRLDFNPQLPGTSTTLRIRDLDYLGSGLDFVCTTDEVLITLQRKDQGAPALVVFLYDKEQILTLDLKKTVRFKRIKGAIFDATIEKKNGDQD